VKPRGDRAGSRKTAPRRADRCPTAVRPAPAPAPAPGGGGVGGGWRGGARRDLWGRGGRAPGLAGAGRHVGPPPPAVGAWRLLTRLLGLSAARSELIAIGPTVAKRAGRAKPDGNLRSCWGGRGVASLRKTIAYGVRKVGRVPHCGFKTKGKRKGERKENKHEKQSGEHCQGKSAADRWEAQGRLCCALSQGRLSGHTSTPSSIFGSAS